MTSMHDFDKSKATFSHISPTSIVACFLFDAFCDFLFPNDFPHYSTQFEQFIIVIGFTESNFIVRPAGNLFQSVEFPGKI